jgi:hypothetical protein
MPIASGFSCTHPLAAEDTHALAFLGLRVGSPAGEGERLAWRFVEDDLAV